MANWVFCSSRRGVSNVAERRSPHRSVEEVGSGEAEGHENTAPGAGEAQVLAPVLKTRRAAALESLFMWPWSTGTTLGDNGATEIIRAF